MQSLTKLDMTCYGVSQYYLRTHVWVSELYHDRDSDSCMLINRKLLKILAQLVLHVLNTLDEIDEWSTCLPVSGSRPSDITKYKWITDKDRVIRFKIISNYADTWLQLLCSTYPKSDVFDTLKNQQTNATLRRICMFCISQNSQKNDWINT